MNVESFQVWNFKSIENSGEICLPRITLLIGPNSSGKSSVFQSLLLMKQTFEAEVSSIPLALSGPYINVGEYNDFIHNKNSKAPFIIKFNFETVNHKMYTCEVCGREYKSKRGILHHVEKEHLKYWGKYKEKILEDEFHIKKQQSLKFQYSYDTKTGTITIEELEFKNPSKSNGLVLSALKIKRVDDKIQIELTSRDLNKIYTKMIKDLDDNGPIDHILMKEFLYNYLSIYDRYGRYDNLHNISINEDMLLLEKDVGTALDARKKKKNLHSEYSSLNEEEKTAYDVESRLFTICMELIIRLKELSIFLHGIHHIGPLRNWPERIYFGIGGKPIGVGEKGEYTQEIFLLDKRIGHESLIKKVNDWLLKLKLDVHIDIENLMGNMYQLKIIQNELSVNIADVGFGLSQILPILTECLNYSSKELDFGIIQARDLTAYSLFANDEKLKKLIICQQPEIHLNPKIQSQLGDFFTQIDDPNLSLLVETHSEHILTRLQRRVADGTLDPNDIAIYFIFKEELSSQVKKLSISKRGEFDYWPEGFFQDDYEDTMEILKASLKRQEGE